MAGYTLSDGITVKNKLGARTHDELDFLQSDFVQSRIYQIELGGGPRRGAFDAGHLRAVHKHLFQDVFEWAGHTREELFRFADGSIAHEPIILKIAGKPFAQGADIAAALDELAAKIRDANYLRDLPREQFAERTADLFAELNTIHPFREGNGRTQRVFFEQLAKQAGHSLDFRPITRERMTQASIGAHEKGDTSMFRRMFVEIASPERAALLREGLEKLRGLYEVNGRSAGIANNQYLATFSPGETRPVTFVGVAGAQFMARTSDQILFGNAADLPTPPPRTGEQFTFHAPSDQEPTVPARLGSLDANEQTPQLSKNWLSGAAEPSPLTNIFNTLRRPAPTITPDQGAFAERLQMYEERKRLEREAAAKGAKTDAKPDPAGEPSDPAPDDKPKQDPGPTFG